MGLFGFIKKKDDPTQQIQEEVLPTAIDPTSLSEQKKNDDLAKLMSFENKLKAKRIENIDKDTTQIVEETSQDLSLKLENPFRGF